jgi:PhoPQ-activated pathogenicity-related protein
MTKQYSTGKCILSILLVFLCISSQLDTFVSCNEDVYEMYHDKDIQKVLDDYMNEPTPYYKWNYTGRSFWTLLGHTAYVLNVTTVQWLDQSDYYLVDGNKDNVWTHEVVVIVPRYVKYRNVSSVYMASVGYRCNVNEPITGLNADIEIADTIANDVSSVVIVTF